MKAQAGGRMFLRAAFVVVVTHLIAPAILAETTDPSEAKAYSMRNLCGVTSAYIVLKDAKQQAAYDEILQSMPPGLYGSTMSQLSRFLTERGMNVMNVMITGDELLHLMRINPNAQAIALFVDHWVVVQETKTRYLCILDPPKKYYLPPTGFDSLCEGAVLLTSPVPLRMQPSRSKTALIAVGLTCIMGGVVVLALVRQVSIRKTSFTSRHGIQS